MNIVWQRSRRQAAVYFTLSPHVPAQKASCVVWPQEGTGASDINHIYTCCFVLPSSCGVCATAGNDVSCSSRICTHSNFIIHGSQGLSPPGLFLNHVCACGQVMLLVSNLQRSVDFYVRVLGMKLFVKVASIDGHLRMAQLGYGDPDSGRTIVELRETGGLIRRGQGYDCSVARQ